MKPKGKETLDGGFGASHVAVLELTMRSALQPQTDRVVRASDGFRSHVEGSGL